MVGVTTAADSHKGFAPPVSLQIHLRAPEGGRPRTVAYLLTFSPYRKELPTFDIRIKEYPYFEPGTSRRYYVATDADVLLEHVVGASLAVGDDPYHGTDLEGQGYGTKWRPETVVLEVNGRQVVRTNFSGTTVGPGQRLDLGWPQSVTDNEAKIMPTELPALPKVKPFDAETIKRIRERVELPFLADTTPAPLGPAASAQGVKKAAAPPSPTGRGD
jgi:hypothetical protein